MKMDTCQMMPQWSKSAVPLKLSGFFLSLLALFANMVVLTTDAHSALNLIALHPFLLDLTMAWQKSSWVASQYLSKLREHRGFVFTSSKASFNFEASNSKPRNNLCNVVIFVFLDLFLVLEFGPAVVLDGKLCCCCSRCCEILCQINGTQLHLHLHPFNVVSVQFWFFASVAAVPVTSPLPVVFIVGPILSTPRNAFVWFFPTIFLSWLWHLLCFFPCEFNLLSKSILCIPPCQL